jgi:outer membrane biosynthesis protein TonB
VKSLVPKCRPNPSPRPFSRLAPVPGPAVSLLAVALGAAAIVLGACGEEDAQLLPGGTAREITANLDTVRVLADEGDCVGAESAALQVSEQVEAVEGVDERLKRALRQGAARLNEVVAECEEAVEAVPDIAPAEVESPSPEEDSEEAEKQKQKDEDSEEREREDEQAEEEAAEAVEETEPTLPPQAEGEGEGAENGNGPSGGQGGGSGGLSPGSPAGEGG